MSEPLARGIVVWVDFSPTVGHEQRGTRPAVVVSSPGYLDSVRDLVIVVPITSVDRGWPHHVPVRGEQTQLPRASFALLLSLLPATAAVVGLVVLRQIPSPAEMLGIALVVAGVALHRPVD